MTAPVIPGPDEPGDATGGDSGQGSDSGNGQDTGDSDNGQNNPDEPMTDPGVKSVYFVTNDGRMQISANPLNGYSILWEPAAKMNLIIEADNPESVQVVEFEFKNLTTSDVVVHRFIPTGTIDGNQVEMISETEIEQGSLDVGFVKVNGYPYRTNE
ncbi:MAG: hypothetical protein ACI3ZK_05395 [Candidatus Cryptobacteroides sp.]